MPNLQLIESQLRAAQVAIESALNLLGNKGIELPPGVELEPSDCDHPPNRRKPAMGGYWLCGDCGFRGKD